MRLSSEGAELALQLLRRTVESMPRPVAPELPYGDPRAAIQEARWACLSDLLKNRTYIDSLLLVLVFLRRDAATAIWLKLELASGKVGEAGVLMHVSAAQRLSAGKDGVTI